MVAFRRITDRLTAQNEAFERRLAEGRLTEVDLEAMRCVQECFGENFLDGLFDDPEQADLGRGDGLGGV